MLETDGRGTGIRPFPRIGSITLEGGGRGGGKYIFARFEAVLDIWGRMCGISLLGSVAFDRR